MAHDITGEHTPSRIAAIAMLCTRGEDGALAMLDPVTAGQLLGSIKKSDQQGQGTMNFYVPKANLVAAGCDMAAWDRAKLPTKDVDGKAHVDVPYEFATTDLLPVLQAWAGKSHEEATALADKYSAAKPGTHAQR